MEARPVVSERGGEEHIEEHLLWRGSGSGDEGSLGGEEEMQQSSSAGSSRASPALAAPEVRLREALAAPEAH